MVGKTRLCVFLWDGGLETSHCANEWVCFCFLEMDSALLFTVKQWWRMVKCNGPSDHTWFGECVKCVHWCIPLAFLLHVLSSLPKSSLRDDFQRLKTYFRSIIGSMILRFFCSLLTSGTILISLTKVLVSVLHLTFAYALVIGRKSKKTTVLFKVLRETFFILQPSKPEKTTAYNRSSHLTFMACRL